jgi:ABC-type bacteriocin/lantibiotic exporter with double-glycine peptidase domain
MTNLKDVSFGQNKFCGPAVLSILTGKSTDECAYTITRINGNYNVSGVTLGDLLKAADRLGFISEAVTPQGSLFRTLSSLVSNDGMYIVTIPKHFICIEIKDKKIYFCDNHTKEPIPAASSARLGMPVTAVNKVFKKPKPPKLEPSYIIVHLVECTHCKARGLAEADVIHYNSCNYKMGLEDE